MKWTRALCCLLSVLLSGALAWAGEPEVSSRAEPEVVHIGEPFTVIVDFVHDRGEAPRFEAFQASDLWWEQAPRRRVTLDLRDEPGRALTQLRYSLVGIEPGEQSLELPRATLDGLEAATSVEVPPVALRILGELAEGEDSPRELAGFPEVPEARPSAMTLGALLAGGLFSVLCATFVGYLAVRMRRRSSTPEVSEPSAVAELLEFDSSDASRAREAFGLASRAVREALDRELGEALPGLTDEEWIERRTSIQSADPSCLPRACELLRTAERVKYGMEQPTRWAVDELLGEARAIVAATPDEGGEW